jgi:hypothetical protein
MPRIFAHPTVELIDDTAICALNDGRDRGLDAWDVRERFLQLAGEAFDRATDPTGEFAPARPDAQP